MRAVSLTSFQNRLDVLELGELGTFGRHGFYNRGVNAVEAVTFDKPRQIVGVGAGEREARFRPPHFQNFVARASSSSTSTGDRDSDRGRARAYIGIRRGCFRSVYQVFTFCFKSVSEVFTEPISRRLARAGREVNQPDIFQPAACLHD